MCVYIQIHKYAFYRVIILLLIIPLFEILIILLIYKLTFMDHTKIFFFFRLNQNQDHEDLWTSQIRIIDCGLLEEHDFSLLNH